MKIKWKVLISTILIGILNVVPVQAAEQESYYGVSVETPMQEITQYLQGGASALARALGQERGSVIDTATAIISNEGGGDIGILVETLAHVECEKIKNLAILERLEGDDWVEIARYEFTAEKKDFPTEDLSGMTNEFTVENQETDCYYRVRGIHCVWADGKAQVFVTQTEGILITEYDY